MFTKPPNILWICTDQQRFDTLGCYGNEFVITPNLDKLASEGLLFQHAYCQSPVCTPSRASFLTGRYPRTTRCRQNGQAIPSDETLVTKLLQDAGYVCGLAGKLHLAPCNPSVCKGTEQRIDDGYNQFFWSHDPADAWSTHDYIQWLEDKGLNRDSKPFPNSTYVRTIPSEEHSQTTWSVEKAMAFITNASRLKQPWLFSVNMFDPHHAFDPPIAALERYRNILDNIPLPNYVDGELNNKPIWQQIDHKGAYGGKSGYPYQEMTEDDHRWVTAAYWAMIDVIDKQVGRLIHFLDEIKQRENTIIIFTSDHGEMLGDHGIYLKGPYFYEPAIRVPLIISGPNMLNNGQHSDELVELVDLAPTLMEAAKLKPYKGMQGKSLYPILTGTNTLNSHRDDVYCEYYNAMGWHREPTANATMVRNKKYKIVAAHGTNSGELYDLEDDPKETNNLWKKSEYQDVKLTMQDRLIDRMAWTVDPLPERQAPW
ncbi:sulfatase-like hydrolase/transferase [Candidatus Poribacteria bacterium]|nr:sulfatase-like hydrolase/transferase [Candidatus Poribacteria bacterium]